MYNQTNESTKTNHVFAGKEPLPHAFRIDVWRRHGWQAVVFLAEISVGSPRKLFIFIILKIFSRKYPKIIFFKFENRRTNAKQMQYYCVWWITTLRRRTNLSYSRLLGTLMFLGRYIVWSILQKPFVLVAVLLLIMRPTKPTNGLMKKTHPRWTKRL